MTEDSSQRTLKTDCQLPVIGDKQADPLEIVEFVEPPAVPISPRRVPAGVSPSIDGPPCWYLGIGESLAWFFGTLFVHLVGGIFVAIALIVVVTVSKGRPPGNLQDPGIMMILMSGEMSIFVLTAIFAVALRYWGRTFRELNLSPPDPRHAWIVIGGTLPLTFCVSAWSMPIQFAWNRLHDWLPSLKFVDGMNTMQLIKELADVVPLPLMILMIAVLPAIGEELVFRGAIGRVLIAHLGVWGGVLLTSFLFGWIHIHPVHALSVMPLGVAIHLVYLTSRSFWLPMLLHFLNNVWATIATQWGAVDPLRHGSQPTIIEGIEIVTAMFSVVALAYLLWQSRVRLFHDDGREWNPGRFIVRAPADATIHRESQRMNSYCWPLAVLSVIICHVTVALDLMLPWT